MNIDKLIPNVLLLMLFIIGLGFVSRSLELFYNTAVGACVFGVGLLVLTSVILLLNYLDGDFTKIKRKVNNGN